MDARIKSAHDDGGRKQAVLRIALDAPVKPGHDGWQEQGGTQVAGGLAQSSRTSQR